MLFVSDLVTIRSVAGSAAAIGGKMLDRIMVNVKVRSIDLGRNSAIVLQGSSS